MRTHVDVKDEHDALVPADRELIILDAEALLSRYRLFREAHLSIRVKTTKLQRKKLTRISANLATDRGSYNASAESFGVEDTLQLCLSSLQTQLDKRQEKMVDKGGRKATA